MSDLREIHLTVCIGLDRRERIERFVWVTELI
jgi:hypothetical protein